MNNKGLILLEVLVIIVVLGILVVLFVPPICDHGQILRAKMASCANNLVQLKKLGNAYAASHNGHWPEPQRENYWVSFTKLKPPLIDQDHLEILSCPVRGEVLGPDECDFLGPTVPWSQLGASDPVAACRAGNHGEGYPMQVLLKDGSVMEAKPGDPLWERCEALLR